MALHPVLWTQMIVLEVCDKEAVGNGFGVVPASAIFNLNHNDAFSIYIEGCIINVIIRSTGSLNVAEYLLYQQYVIEDLTVNADQKFFGVPFGIR